MKFGLAVMGIIAALSAAGPSLAGSPALDKVVEKARTQGLAGEVLVTDRHHVTYARALSAPGRPHRRGDLWRWASVTKQLTATLVLQEVARGSLSLDDTLPTRLPAFRGATAGGVTIRMLLQHTSGLPNPDDTAMATPADLPDFYRRRTPGAGGPADALGYCAGSVKGQPGAAFSYNNCDFIVLGAVLQRVTGQSFPALLRARITRPLGLKTLRVAQVGLPLKSTPGRNADGSPEPAFELATFGPAGAGVGASDDLARFDQALLSGRLLPPPQTEAAWKGEPKLGYVALGVWSFPAPLRGCRGAVDLVERRGEIGGVEVRNLLAPKLGLALIVFADQAGLDFGEIWQGRGLTYELASAAFCPDETGETALPR
ncbi:serine hydrolase domain-containing protein [Caulobacter sp. DWP3-1-3b2]|uniref:serine hydrolase domain-containing protein n=1 Tax=Caulobacter sp. DWP3-1-3b2 TaxID=2804643 RepID=UPI003CEBF0FA